MTVPTIGDILMLSQVAWKIGRAFSASRKQAPTEFQDVEAEIGGLAKALKLLAETLHAESEKNLVNSADSEIQNGISTIWTSCQRTVNDLDSLIDQYQVIKKHRTVGGFAIERSWSDLVLAEYKTMMWTTEGGNLGNLRDLLQMHTSSMTVLTQALQRLVTPNSVSRLESVVTPMAERIDSMYHLVGSMDEQLDEVHRMVQNLAITLPNTQAPPIPTRNPTRSPTAEISNLSSPKLASSSPPTSPPRRATTKFSLPRAPQRPSSTEQSSSVNMAAPSSHTETMSTSRASSPTMKRVPEFSLGGSSLRYSSSSYASSDTGTSSAGRQSPSASLNDLYSGRNLSTSTTMTSPPFRIPQVLEHEQQANKRHLSMLPPPPPMGLATPYVLEPSTSHTSPAKLSPYPSPQPGLTKLHRSSTTASQRAAFEKEAFRNSAILCDVRGRLVEYSHRINDDDPRDVEMVHVSHECRIAVVRKRVTNPETRSVHVVTSVWAFSDDNTARVELRMEDDQMYIPYSSYFSPSKVSITVPCTLKFHAIKHDANRPARVAKTNWVNYVFDTPQAATLFQNELMGRTLLATFRTSQTMRLHHGLSAPFSYSTQMCGLETLRVWQDNDTGAFIALIHFSADFRNGYLAFYLNDAASPVRVKDEGGRVVKVRGLRVPVERDGGVEGRGKVDKEKEKVISGAKIEFATEMEKREFLDMCRELQRELIFLPDLLGVN
ncbi:hypothetical protein BDW02DRAFT_636866 [Decorospora gaudefroyi]|uniref:Fungal N-terminal domain-containing protein n=1 Tax=Decorospora gaudefroyi TaxID=184978 RepID=A0A6A5KNV7_9PLEO|nr:hypothetical protein BDW02DRAFT_636866 [Decorospora gaudefroyi]